MTASPDASASLFAGRYRLLRTIGEGHAATVYLARDVRAERLVALKVFHALRLGQPLAAERLVGAAWLWRQVRHPNLVTLHDFGRTQAPGRAGQPSEVHYLAMQHIPGRSLAWYVRTRGPLAVGEGACIARQILAGLTAAHAVGLVHQDLRPQNVMLAPDGVVKLTDLGLAEAVGYSTPHYLSPEQAQGQPALVASDVYALGVILYEMLADAVPFDSIIPEVVLLKHAGEAPPPPRRLRPTIPPGLQDVVLRALAKRPEVRWESPAAMDEALAPYAEIPQVGRRPSRWGAMLAVREEDPSPRSGQALAPTPAGGLAVARDLLPRPVVAARLFAVALVLAVALVYWAGWRVHVTAPGPPDSVTSGATATPVLTSPTTPTAPPVTPTGLVATRSTPPSPADCPAPEHPSPAVAEALQALAEEACASPVWEGVAAALAAARSVEIGFGQPEQNAYGLYDPGASRVVLAQSVANEAPRARAAVLLHELTHVRERQAGGLGWAGDVLACYEAEYRAFRAEAAFWRLSQARRGAPQPASALESDLDHITAAIDRGSADFIVKDLVARYGASCKPATRD